MKLYADLHTAAVLPLRSPPNDARRPTYIVGHPAPGMDL